MVPKTDTHLIGNRVNTMEKKTYWILAIPFLLTVPVLGAVAYVLSGIELPSQMQEWQFLIDWTPTIALGGVLLAMFGLVLILRSAMTDPHLKAEENNNH